MNVRGWSIIFRAPEVPKNYSQHNMDTEKSFDGTRISVLGQRIKNITF